MLFRSIAIFVFVFAVLALPCYAQDKSQQSFAGAMGLVAALLYGAVPWATGLIADILITRTKVKLLKAILTAVLGMVLGYPSIWFGLTGFLAGGPESMVAWVLCAVFLTIILGTVKVVSYWVINEAFPSKVTALLLYASAIAMVAAAFVTLTISAKPPAV